MQRPGFSLLVGMHSGIATPPENRLEVKGNTHPVAQKAHSWVPSPEKWKPVFIQKSRSNVHSHATYNCSDLEKPVYPNQWMNKAKVVLHLCHTMLVDKKKVLLINATAWTGLKGMSELKQTSLKRLHIVRSLSCTLLDTTMVKESRSGWQSLQWEVEIIKGRLRQFCRQWNCSTACL